METSENGQKETGLVGVRWSLNLATTSSIVVLFPSPMEAEMAHQSLSPHVQPYHRAVGKELTVNGSIIAMSVCKGAWAGGGCLGSF